VSVRFAAHLDRGVNVEPGAFTPPSQVAYAISRAVGNAVVRNQLRRRLRAICQQAAEHDILPKGLMMIMVQPEVVDHDFASLRATVEALFAEIGAGDDHHRG